MSYYIYPRPRMSRGQHLKITVVAIVVAIIATYCVVNIGNNKEVKALNDEIKNQQTQIAYYQEYETKYNSVLEREKHVQEFEKIIEEQGKIIPAKDQKIKELTDYVEELVYINGQFENRIKKISSAGVRPINYKLPEPVSRGSYDSYKGKLVDVGEWLGTYYAPNKEECGNNKGITCSGQPIIPGKTIAVDPAYWPLGTKFYIEGFGEVIATDTGSAIKGRNRFDFAVFSTHISNSGSFKARVYLIVED